MEAGVMSTKVPHVLFLDDEPSLLEALRRNLRKSGWEMHFLQSPAEALSLLEQQYVDLIISDMYMPGMDGVTFLSKAAEKRPDSVRLILTGNPDLDSTIDAINRGKIHGFLTKPVEIQHLQDVLEAGIKVTQAKRRQSQMLYTLAKSNKALKAELEQTLNFVSQTQEALRDTYSSTVEVFAKLLEGFRSQLLQRPFRAGIYCRLLIDHMQFEPELARQTYFATLLHDIGKVGMPRHLFNTPFRQLSKAEQAEYEKYPIASSTALLGTPELEQAASFILAHREHIDGSGYPHHLSGGAISEGALITGITTYFDELLDGDESPRAIKAALQQLELVKNKHFPYELVDTFKEVIEDYYHLGDREYLSLVDPEKLQAGMVVGRGLYGSNGMRLLSQGTRLNDRLIEKLREYHTRVNPTMRVAIVQQSQVRVN
ncbi:hypothetical protein WH50_23395 [Pokkaliibacter plantistimulans]|uniref:Response regulator n=2 Tax=Pokkaliibacter plantistimulans TaxID=1635171 RepID=A0ABX5LUX9_9GAMM|nr:hypothetical protein WH50_23395 [Pokkaliibacter plantistimulans]